MLRVETSSLHRGVAGARHTFVPLPGAANKLDLLLQVGKGGGAGRQGVWEGDFRPHVKWGRSAASCGVGGPRTPPTDPPLPA